VLAEFDQAKAWVQAVAWAPSGFRIAFSGHGSSMHFVQLLAGSQPVVQSVILDKLPYLECSFLSDDVVVAAGFEYAPHIFAVTGGTDSEPAWTFVDTADKAEKKAEAPKAAGSAFAASHAKFAAAVVKGQTGETKIVEKTIDTIHKNNINCMQVFYPADSKPATTFSTSGLDGRVVFWDLKTKKHIDLKKLKLA